jgi:hypothetical protein
MFPSIIYIVLDLPGKGPLVKEAIVFYTVVRGKTPDLKESHLKVQGPFRESSYKLSKFHLGTTTSIRWFQSNAPHG